MNQANTLQFIKMSFEFPYTKWSINYEPCPLEKIARALIVSKAKQN